MSYRNAIPLSNKELIIGCITLFLTVLLVAESRWSRLHNSQAISPEDPVHLYLDGPTNLASLAQMLADSGLIKAKNEFKWAANIFGWRNFREGHYLVDQGFKYDEFLSKLARGIQDPVSVTILPGRPIGDIVDAVSDDLQFDSLSFHQTISDTAFLAEMDLDPKEVLGRLYPNTYSIYWTSTPKSFFQRIQEEFNKSVVQAHQQQFKKIERSVSEIITLASIVEWEAKNSEEKKTISGLYWNRLNMGMPLQADPTVNFAIGERRRLLYEDYQVDHPYNTYQYRGLPPGPITNPDLESIKAALYPQDHEYLYMVASPDGSHSFSKTFEEHKRKSAEWRRWIQEQYRIKRQRESSE